MKKFPVILTLAVLQASLAMNGYADNSMQETDRSIPPGCVGYVVHLPSWTTFGLLTGGYVGCEKGPSTYRWQLFHGVHVEVINVSPQTYDEEFKILTQDKLMMDFHARITIAVKDPVIKSTQEIVEHYQGNDWYKKIVEPNVQAYVREATTGIDSIALNNLDSRTKIEASIQDKLQKFFADKPFTVSAVNINQIKYPDLYVALIEQTAMLEQRTLQAQLQETTAQAQKKANVAVAEAEGAALVKRAEMQAEAQEKLARTLSPLIIQYKAVEALKDLVQSTNKATIYIPVGAAGVPLIPTIGTDNVRP